MWAAFTSDLREFASGAAEETTAVASKVGVNIATDAPSSSGGGGQRGGASVADGSVLLANAALSMGGRGLEGLRGMSSMVGGMVAPTAPAAGSGAPAASGSSGSSFASSGAPGKPSAALSSMMLADDDDEEEVELGWDDDDDDDLDIDDEEDGGVDKKTSTGVAAGPTDFFEEHLGADGEGSPNEPTNGEGNSDLQSSPDNEVLQALQSKLEAVEKARAELQIEHRGQTAELVELRAKVEELEKQKPAPGDDKSGRSEAEVQSLEQEIKQLKVQLEEQLSRKEELPLEHRLQVEALIKEKEALEKRVEEQKLQNERLAEENRTLQGKVGQASKDKAASQKETEKLEEYQQQIKVLTADLRHLQGALAAKASALSNAEKAHALALKESEESKARLSVLEAGVKELETEDKAEGVVLAAPAAATLDSQDEPTGAAKVEEVLEEEKQTTPIKLDAEEEEDDWGDEDW